MGPNARAHTTCRRNGFRYKGPRMYSHLFVFLLSMSIGDYQWVCGTNLLFSPFLCTTSPFNRPVDDAIGFRFPVLPRLCIITLILICCHSSLPIPPNVTTAHLPSSPLYPIPCLPFPPFFEIFVPLNLPAFSQPHRNRLQPVKK